MSMDELDVIRELGKGGYSVVHLVRRRCTEGGAAGGKLCAESNREELVGTPKRAEHVFAERDASEHSQGVPCGRSH